MEMIKGASVALEFIKLKSELGDDWFESEYPYTHYKEYEWDDESRSMQKADPHFITYMDCSDWFYWGSSDSEELTEENFHLLKETIAELKPIWQELNAEFDKFMSTYNKRNSAHARAFEAKHGKLPHPDYKPLPFDPSWEEKHRVARHAERLFCAKVRNMRPQGAAYRYIPESLKALYDAAGEPRDIDLFNPKTQTDKYEYKAGESVTPSEV